MRALLPAPDAGRRPKFLCPAPPTKRRPAGRTPRSRPWRAPIAPTSIPAGVVPAGRGNPRRLEEQTGHAASWSAVRWTSQVWLDGRPIGDAQDSLIAPHVYDLGVGIAPGKHTLTIRVDNTVKVSTRHFRFRPVWRHAHRHERHRGSDRVACRRARGDRRRAGLSGRRAQAGPRPRSHLERFRQARAWRATRLAAISPLELRNG